jgi:hypothetical protein
MKPVILLFPLLCGLGKITVGQQNILFIYIASEKGVHDSALITSVHFPRGYLESKILQVYYTDQRTIDTVRSYISHSN